MRLFAKKEKPCCCKCDGKDLSSAVEKQGKGANVKILGGGCAKCNALEAATLQALSELGLDTSIDHVRDFAEIASYGVMTTPALVYNRKVLSYGKVLKVEEVKKLLEKEI